MILRFILAAITVLYQLNSTVIFTSCFVMVGGRRSKCLRMQSLPGGLDSSTCMGYAGASEHSLDRLCLFNAQYAWALDYLRLPWF